jgi:hypothetical protein
MKRAETITHAERNTSLSHVNADQIKRQSQFARNNPTNQKCPFMQTIFTPKVKKRPRNALNS